MKKDGYHIMDLRSIIVMMLAIACLSSGTPLLNHDDPIEEWTETDEWRDILQRASDVSDGEPIDIRKTTRIVGGSEIKPHSWPFLVLICARQNRKAMPICGGTVLDENHILSAARCFRIQEDGYLIVAAEHDYTRFQGNEQVRDVANITRHPGYNGSDISSNNVAILKLSRALSFAPSADADVKKVELNDDPNCPQVNETCIELGWGRLTYEGAMSYKARQVQVPVQSDTLCSSLYSQSYGPDQMCAGEKEKGHCHGDYGGPVLCSCGGDRQKQVGIISYGQGCGLEGYPGVSSRVSYFISWIEETVRNM